jgi:chromosome segregation ATPase
MKKTICILICWMICLLPVSAEPAAEDAGAVARELAGIRASLDRLAGLLQDARAGQHAQLLLRRIERREVRLATLEARLRSQQGNKAGDEEQLAQIVTYRTTVDDEIRAARDRGELVPAQKSEMMIRQIEAEEKNLKERIERSATRIRDLEDEVAEGREAIEDLDLRLEEILALMDESD